MQHEHGGEHGGKIGRVLAAVGGGGIHWVGDAHCDGPAGDGERRECEQSDAPSPPTTPRLARTLQRAWQPQHTDAAATPWDACHEEQEDAIGEEDKDSKARGRRPQVEGDVGAAHRLPVQQAVVERWCVSTLLLRALGLRGDEDGVDSAAALVLAALLLAVSAVVSAAVVLAVLAVLVIVEVAG